jgi:hypothetical protein
LTPDVKAKEQKPEIRIDKSVVGTQKKETGSGTEKYFVKIETFVILNGKIMWIIDPIDDFKVEGNFYKNQIVEQDKTLYAVVGKADYEKYITRKTEKHRFELAYNRMDQENTETAYID